MLSVFIVDHLPTSGEVILDGDEGHHAAKVTRVNVGEEFIVTDGRGRSARVKVNEVHKEKVTCSIISTEIAQALPISFSVLQALTKGDRARETIELLTEAGVDHVIPWNAARCIGQWKEEDESRAKWQMWAREATKQSRRSWIPQISPLFSTRDAITALSQYDCTLLFDEGTEVKVSTLLKDQKYSKVLVIIGPEGGITPDEREEFVKAGAHVVGMGRPVFRSAHAGAVALAAVQTALGIW